MSTKKSVPRQVFKAYDIRGLHETQLTPEFVSLFARNLVFWAQKNDHFSSARVAVGYDMRPSSPALEQALIESLCAIGAQVYRFGCVSTPAFYYGVGAVEADLGVMISASHNGPEYNGLKVTLANAVPVSGASGLQEIADLMEIDAASVLPWYTERSITNVDVAFAASQAAFIALPPAPIAPFRVVCDSANGMGAQFLDHLAILCPELKLDRLFWELDGTFPNHPADPLDEANLHAIKERIRETGADLGIATDGDGDRVFFLDETGEVVPPAIVRGLLAQFVLQRVPESVICYDVRPGKITEDLIWEAGGKPHLTRVGHSLIKDEMQRVDAAFGGESSGHFFYRLDNGIYESPLVAILDMLRELTRRGTSFSQMVKPYKRYAHSGERNFRVADTNVAITKIAALFPEMTHSTLDGLSCADNDVWFNVRASNTEPLLRVNIEGKTTEGVSATLSAITDLLIS